jgi:hypothetical protein
MCVRVLGFDDRKLMIFPRGNGTFHPRYLSAYLAVAQHPPTPRQAWQQQQQAHPQAQPDAQEQQHAQQELDTLPQAQHDLQQQEAETVDDEPWSIDAVFSITILNPTKPHLSVTRGIESTLFWQLYNYTTINMTD